MPKKNVQSNPETDRFITPDGDNIVMDDFFEQILEVPKTDHDGNDIRKVFLVGMLKIF